MQVYNPAVRLESLKLREEPAVDFTVDLLYTERGGAGSKSLVDLHFL